MRQDQELRIIELRSKGYSYTKLAKEVGVAKQTAIDICKRREEELSTLKAIELETLYETLQLSKEERIKGTATLLSRIRKEIEGRPLEEVPTDKLISLYLKTTETLKEELLDPRFQSTEEQLQGKSDREFLDKITRNRN